MHSHPSDGADAAADARAHGPHDDDDGYGYGYGYGYGAGVHPHSIHNTRSTMPTKVGSMPMPSAPTTQTPTVAMIRMLVVNLRPQDTLGWDSHASQQTSQLQASHAARSHHGGGGGGMRGGEGREGRKDAPPMKLKPGVVVDWLVAAVGLVSFVGVGWGS